MAEDIRSTSYVVESEMDQTEANWCHFFLRILMFPCNESSYADKIDLESQFNSSVAAILNDT